MLVEAIDKPMCYRWPEGEVQLVPGQPVDLPESRALRLLQKAHGKVRVVSLNSILAVRPGSWISWLGPDGKDRTGVVDFVHSARGELWAFCALSDGSWCARNTKYLTIMKPGAST